jgi:2-keto-3-deoxy-L-rhamnonate aldolase RhmA
LQDPKLRAALEKMIAACQKHRKPWGYPVGTIDDAKKVVELGGQFLVFGNEFWAIHNQLQSCSAQLDTLLGGGS